jgi:hypothetical protein
MTIMAPRATAAPSRRAGTEKAEVEKEADAGVTEGVEGMVNMEVEVREAVFFASFSFLLTISQCPSG